MRVMLPGRIVNRHVGGNTTYARRLADGLSLKGIEVVAMPDGGHPISTAAWESYTAIRPQREQSVLHYSADTGPVLRTVTPSVVTVHGIASLHVRGIRSESAERLWRWRVRRAIACTDGLITVSESSAQDLMTVFGVNRADIAVIPHGIDYERFSIRRSSATVPVPPGYALYVGNLEPRKNLVELIRAFGRPDLRATGLQLVIAGRTAWNYQEIMLAIGESDNVTYLGFVDEDTKVALLQHAALFIFPSLYEGFGFPVLEAMAAGTPALTSSRGSLAEITGPALRLRDLTREGIASSVIEALNIYSNVAAREAAIDAGRQWAQGFSWKRSVDQHLAVYNEVIEIRKCA